MQLLEVYVQGVGRFLTPFKFSLAKGYNVVYGGNDTGKSALAQSMVATFDAAQAALAQTLLQPQVPTDTPARYGLLFEHGGERYRLLRNLSGGLNLARLDASTGKFELVAKDEAGAAVFLQDNLDFPLEGLYAALGRIDRASLMPGAGAAAQPAPAADMFGGYEDEAPPAAGNDDIGAQIAQLNRELNLVESVGDLEFRLDGVQKKQYDIEARLAKFRDMAKQESDLRKRLESLALLEQVDADTENRIRNLDRHEQFQGQKLHALDQEIAALEKQLDILEPKLQKRFQKDPFFLAGAAVTLLGLTLPFFTKIYFLSLFGFGGGGWLAYLLILVYPKLQSDYAEADRKYKAKCAEEERAKKDFETQMAAITQLVKSLKVLDAKDLGSLLTEYRKLQEDLVELQRGRETYAAENGDEAKLQADKTRSEAEVALFQEELSQAGAITRDAHQIRAEIARLEKIQAVGGVAAAMPAATAAAQVHAQPAVGGTSLAGMVQAGAQAARRDLATFVPMLAEKFAVYLRAIAPRYGVNGISPEGEPSLTRQGVGAGTIDLARIGQGDRDAIVLALRCALLEITLPARQFPLIVDDPFGNLDDMRQAAAGKFLKRLSSVTQVVHLTSQKSFLQIADHQVELK